MGVHDADPIRPPAALMASTVVLAGRISRLAADLLAGALAPLGLRGRHYSILMALAESGPASQQHLGRSLLIDRTTMVSIVDDLERLGLVVRATDPDDRRAYRVELTGRGRTSLVRATGAVARAERTLLAGLSTDEQAVLRSLMRRVVEHHEGDVGGDGKAAVPPPDGKHAEVTGARPAPAAVTPAEVPNGPTASPSAATSGTKDC